MGLKCDLLTPRKGRKIKVVQNRTMGAEGIIWIKRREAAGTRRKLRNGAAVMCTLHLELWWGLK